MSVKIPLRRFPSDTIGCVVEGIPLQFRNRWNDRDASWHVDILTETGVPIVMDLKLLSNINLTARYIDDRIPTTGDFYSIDTGLGTGGRPVFDSLGDTINLWFILDSELA